MDKIKIFYKVETTGLNPKKHSIHRISGLAEVNGEVVEHFDIEAGPNPKAKIDKEALQVTGADEDTILGYQPMFRAQLKFIYMLKRHVDPFDKNSKAWMVGYNNRGFDDVFLRAWFNQCLDYAFGSWFWSDSIDVSVLASEYLESRRPGIVSFRMQTVAKELGLEVDQNRTTESLYKARLIREIYRIVTGREVEI